MFNRPDKSHYKNCRGACCRQASDKTSGTLSCCLIIIIVYNTKLGVSKVVRIILFLYPFNRWLKYNAYIKAYLIMVLLQSNS